MPIEFSEVITTAAELRCIVREPSDLVVEKAVYSLDRHSRDFIERSPFMLISSVYSAGNMDISPKGDPIGFVHILDDYTIAIPDRKGNRRTDTFKNILENPRVGLFFMVPGYRETLRISGTALIVRDIALRQPMKIKDVVPDLASVVRIEEMFFHCAKCIIRSGLWDHRNWNDVKGMGTLADALVEQVVFQNDAEVLHTQIEESYEKNLY